MMYETSPWLEARIVKIGQATHIATDGEREPTFSKYGRPIIEVCVEFPRGDARGYLPLSATHRPDGKLSLWGQLVEAVTGPGAPRHVTPAELVGKPVRVRLERRGSRWRVVAWAQVERRSWRDEQDERFDRALDAMGGAR